MSLLNTLRLTMTLFFPQAIGFGAELKITCSRIQVFSESQLYTNKKTHLFPLSSELSAT